MTYSNVKANLNFSILPIWSWSKKRKEKQFKESMARNMLSKFKTSIAHFILMLLPQWQLYFGCLITKMRKEALDTSSTVLENSIIVLLLITLISKLELFTKPKTLRQRLRMWSTHFLFQTRNKHCNKQSCVRNMSKKS